MEYPVNPAAVKYLANADPALGRLMQFSGGLRRSLEPDPFIALTSAIVAQQLSASAADTIWARFRTLAGKVTPSRVMALESESMRACGLSFQKIGYIQNIASAFLSGALSDRFLRTADDAAVVRALTGIKGVGQWTAEMFLIFCLGREDVFSYGDLGLRKGMAWLYGLPDEPSPEFAAAVNRLWSPFNSTASLYLWEVTLQNLFKPPRIHTLYPEFWHITGGTDYLSTPVGTLKIISTPLGLTEISLCAPAARANNPCPLIQAAKKQLSEYFGGDRRVFDLPLAAGGTDTQQTVWAALRTLPFGQTITAKSLAACVGKKIAPQAVTSANQKNRLQILVPAHRLVRADGGIHDPVQKWLLAHEAHGQGEA